MAIDSVVTQTKTVGSGTYTPTTGMIYCIAVAIGGGGGGGAITNIDEASGGGGGGGCAVKVFTAADIGASKAYDVGSGGATTNAGGTTRLGAAASEILMATGGQPGAASGNTAVLGTGAAGGAGGVGTLGDLNFQGQPGMRAIIYSTTHGSGGAGGCAASFMGMGGGGGAQSGSEAAGNNGGAYGGGGGGAHTATDVNRNGGTGGDGVLFIIEYVGT